MTVSRQSTELLEATLRELFQAESSATAHPRVESERLAGTPPGSAMEELALHADGQLEELVELARLRGITPAPAAQAIGRTLSAMRDNLADLTTTTEQSYRVTLLGIRHGVDLVRLLRSIALKAHDDALKAWTETWLLRRAELLDGAEAELLWFACNPDRALAPVSSRPLALIARSALRAFGKLDTGTAARAT